MGRGDLNFPVVPPAGPVAGEVVATDTSLNFWLVYLKYNNGRFFANVEYSWVNIDTYKTLNGVPTTDCCYSFAKLFGVSACVC